MNHILALRFLAEEISMVYVPIMMLLGLIGLLGYWDAQVVSQLLDVLPVEKWPHGARLLYQVIS